MTRSFLVNLIPTLLFRSGLYRVWQNIPRAVRSPIVRAFTTRLPTRPRRPEGDLHRPPYAIIGMHSSSTSFGWGVGATVRHLREQGHEPYLVDVAPIFGLGDEPAVSVLNGTWDDVHNAQTIILHVNPNQTAYAISGLPKINWLRPVVVGYFVWELEEVPDDWRDVFECVDEIWCPSTFVRGAFQKSGFEKPISVISHEITVPDDTNPDRSGFSIPADKKVFIAAFNYRSGLARKNVFNTIRTFIEAAKKQQDIYLVLKTHGSEFVPAEHRRLQDYVGDHPRIQFINDDLTNERMWSLVASVDAVLSLHRAEGYGLLLKQGLLLDKYVVATDWSGSKDFMTGPKAVPVPYKLVPVDDPDGPFAKYPHLRWAEPDFDAAVAQIIETAEKIETAPPS
ncbi:MAG: hypothetical protein RIC14_00505 [Filomicrobium sp.]